MFIYCNVFLNLLYVHIVYYTFHAVGSCLYMNAICTNLTTMSCQVVVLQKIMQTQVLLSEKDNLKVFYDMC